MKRLIFFILMVMSLAGCSDGTGQDLYRTAQFEERQNNLQHARELYQELVDKYPDSPYGKDAAARLLVLNPQPN